MGEDQDQSVSMSQMRIHKAACVLKSLLKYCEALTALRSSACRRVSNTCGSASRRHLLSQCRALAGTFSNSTLSVFGANDTGRRSPRCRGNYRGMATDPRLGLDSSKLRDSRANRTLAFEFFEDRSGAQNGRSPQWSRRSAQGRKQIYGFGLR